MVVVRGLIVVPSIIIALDGTIKILFDNLLFAFDIYRASLLYRRRPILRRVIMNIALSRSAWHTRSSIHIIGFSVQHKSSRSTTWNMHRSPLIIIRSDSSDFRAAFPYISPFSLIKNKANTDTLSYSPLCSFLAFILLRSTRKFIWALA